MTRHFGSMSHLAAHMAALAAREGRMNREALEKAAKLVEKRAKAKPGEYQGAAPPFAGWAQLADATMADRTRRGFPEDEPLLRTGEMLRSIGHRVGDGAAQVGSDSDIAVYQELGTRSIPPRSFLGGAMAESLEEVKEIVGRSARAWLTGEEVHEGSVRID